MNTAENMVVIIDYGSGNLRSAAKSFEKVIANNGLNFQVKVTNKADDITQASHIVLPGQGAFADCMQGLQNLDGMIDALQDSVINKARPFLGICVGMQLMASRGLEHGITAGLDWIPGDVIPMQPNDPQLKIPHMGWNELVFPYAGDQNNQHFVLRNVKSSDHFYFVHSFMFKCNNNHHIVAMADYGGLVPAVVGRDNMIGMQFHPEKSQNAGLQLLGDFLQWKP